MGKEKDKQVTNVADIVLIPCSFPHIMINGMDI